MARIVLGQEARKKLELVLLLNNVIHNQIGDLIYDILDQVISDGRSSSLKISLQLDESTDVTNCSQLIALIRYFSDSMIKEDVLFCDELKPTTQGKDVYQLVKDFFAKHDLDIQIIGSVCADGTPVMLGNKSGFSALMKREIPHFHVTHCFLHRHGLAAKTFAFKSEKSTRHFCNDHQLN